MDDDDNEMLDNTLEQFETYNDYLDSRMEENELFYLEDIELARQLIAVGSHGKGEIMTQEQFLQRKEAYQKAKKDRQNSNVKALAHATCPIEGDSFLMALAQREEALRNGRMTTIIFLRIANNGRNEISGYIDLADRMKTEDFRKIFMKKKLLVPKSSDLSFFNWDSNTTHLNDSANFRSDPNAKMGLQFRNLRDRKVINVNPDLSDPGDGTTREECISDDYTQVVFFDH